jgi:hypothetical protein
MSLYIAYCIASARVAAQQGQQGATSTEEDCSNSVIKDESDKQMIASRFKVNTQRAKSNSLLSP